MNATIWLTKGNHFFFFCDTFKTEPQEFGPLQKGKLCMLESLVAEYPLTDNVNLAIRSYKCDSTAAKNTSRAREDLAWFYSVCSNLGPEAMSDERAVVHVNSAAFFFNITRSAVFEDLVFDGINAFA